MRLPRIFAITVLVAIIALPTKNEVFGASTAAAVMDQASPSSLGASPNFSVSIINCPEEADQVPTVQVVDKPGSDFRTLPTTSQQLTHSVYRLDLTLVPGVHWLWVGTKHCNWHSRITINQGLQRYWTLALVKDIILDRHGRCSVSGQLPLPDLKIELVSSEGQVLGMTAHLEEHARERVGDAKVENGEFYFDNLPASMFYVRIGVDGPLDPVDVPVDLRGRSNGENCAPLVHDISLSDLANYFQAAKRQDGYKLAGEVRAPAGNGSKAKLTMTAFDCFEDANQVPRALSVTLVSGKFTEAPIPAKVSRAASSVYDVRVVLPEGQHRIELQTLHCSSTSEVTMTGADQHRTVALGSFGRQPDVVNCSLRGSLPLPDMTVQLVDPYGKRTANGIDGLPRWQEEAAPVTISGQTYYAYPTGAHLYYLRVSFLPEFYKLDIPVDFASPSRNVGDECSGVFLRRDIKLSELRDFYFAVEKKAWGK